MKTYIQMLQDIEVIQERLERDGWQIKKITQDSRCLQHRQVVSETEARWRLHQLGLLISPTVRLEFAERVWQEAYLTIGSSRQ